MNRLTVFALAAVAALSACDFGSNGGNDAGPQSCLGGCQAWQTCKPNVVGGTCENVTLRIVVPDRDGVEFGGGAVVRFAVTATQWDGEPLSTTLPVSLTGPVSGPTMLTESATTPGAYEGDYSLMNQSGTVEFTAGWPTNNVKRNLRVAACSTGCADWQECVPQDGGFCRDLNLRLTWYTPNEGQSFAPSLPVVLSLQVRRLDGGAFAKDVPFTMTGGGTATGTLSRVGTTDAWSGSAMVDGTNGARTVVAGWDGGPVSPPKSFNVDAQPPQLGIVVPNTYFQRDDLVYAVVTADESLSDAGVRFGDAEMKIVDAGVCSNFGSTSNAQFCVELDCSAPTLNALDAGLLLTLSGTDRFGNSTSGFQAGTRNVSRLRWLIPATLTTDAGTLVRASPALAPDGTLVLGSTDGTGVAGALIVVRPDGGIAATPNLGAVQGVAVATSVTPATTFGESVAYFSANLGTTGVLDARRASDLSATNLGSPTQGPGTPTFSGIGLYAANSAEIGSCGTFNANLPIVESKFVRFRPQTVPNQFSAPDGGRTYDMVTTVQIPTANNLIVDGTTVVFPTRRNGNGTTVQIVAGVSNVNPSEGGYADLSVSGASSVVSGLAWTGTQSLAGGAGGNLASFYRISNAGTLVQSGNLTVDADNGLAAILNPTTAFAGRGDDVVRFDPSNLVLQGTPMFSSTGLTVRTSPVLGQGRQGGDDKGYAISASGQLIVFDLSGPMTNGVSFGLPFGTSTSVAASPTLDCNRRVGAVATTTTGVLYVVALGGQTAAVVVDSPRLNETAIWPKYQRTAGNAGNTDNTRFPLNPGCPP